MSIWTYVESHIQFEGIPGITPEPHLGNPCTFDDICKKSKKFEECDMPCGSEGSLKISYWSCDTINSRLVRWDVRIKGSLRGFDDNDSEKIIKYFNRIVKNQTIRQGWFSFYTADEDNYVESFVYDLDELKFIYIGNVL